MKAKNIFKIYFLLNILILTAKSSPTQPIYPIQLNVPEKGSLNDNSYIFYKLTLQEIPLDSQENLILRADEDKSEVTEIGIQYHFSDPDIYPKDPETSSWYCN